jgi:hypothetical protein
MAGDAMPQVQDGSLATPSSTMSERFRRRTAQCGARSPEFVQVVASATLPRVRSLRRNRRKTLALRTGFRCPAFTRPTSYASRLALSHVCQLAHRERSPFEIMSTPALVAPETAVPGRTL